MSSHTTLAEFEPTISGLIADRSYHYTTDAVSNNKKGYFFGDIKQYYLLKLRITYVMLLPVSPTSFP